jgi:hypothetical protein
MLRSLPGKQLSWTAASIALAKKSARLIPRSEERHNDETNEARWQLLISRYLSQLVQDGLWSDATCWLGGLGSLIAPNAFVKLRY